MKGLAWLNHWPNDRINGSIIAEPGERKIGHQRTIRTRSAPAQSDVRRGGCREANGGVSLAQTQTSVERAYSASACGEFMRIGSSYQVGLYASSTLAIFLAVGRFH